MEKRLLIIDDEKVIRNSFELTFEGSEFHVDTAESGIEGIEKIKSSHYHLIFLDLKMPEIDGVETLRKIRKIDPDIPIYIFTAFHRQYFKELEKVATDGLSFEIAHKPLDGDQLLELVNQLLNIE